MSIKPYLTSHLLEEGCAKFPEKTALKHRERSITYRDLHDESLRMKTLLLDRGLKRGDRVGILLDKSIEQMVCMFGVSMAGGIFVFINPILKSRQIEHVMSDCEVSVLITTGKLYRKSELTTPQRVVLLMDENPGEEPFPYWYRLREGIAADPAVIRGVADDIASLIYTSGSTGLPKGVVVPHRTIVEGAQIVSSYLQIDENDRVISVLPFNFDYGLNQATTSLLRGATLILHHFFMVNDLIRVLQTEKITGFAGMNPIWVKLFDEKYGARPGQEFPHLRYITNSGGKVPRSIVKKLQSFFPTSKIFLMYGLTEAFRSTYLPPEEIDRRPDSIGKAIPNVEILVMNGKARECGPGEPGELVHRGALITRGYWNDHEKTNEVFRKNPLLSDQEHLHETVVYSGDIVKKDAEGFLYFVSRRDEMIKSSGYRVSPTEVEELLIEIPGVRNAVVFGKETSNGDQGIIAVLESSVRSEDGTLLMQECRKRLPAYMIPQVIYIEQAFALTANGKVDRSSIKEKWLHSEG